MVDVRPNTQADEAYEVGVPFSQRNVYYRDKEVLLEYVNIQIL